MANIYLDIDDTLADHTSEFVNYINEKYKINLNKNELKDHDCRNLLFSKFNLHSEIFREFHKSSNFKKINPMDGSLSIITDISKFHNLFLITGRPFDLKDVTENWVSNFFPNCFSNLYITQQFPNDGEIKGPNKLEICQKLKCSIAIDDDPLTALKMANDGMSVLLFDQPWNKDIEHEKITRVFNWQQINNLLNKEEFKIKDGNIKRI